MRRTQSSSAATGAVCALLRRRRSAAASLVCSGPDLSTASVLSLRRLGVETAPQASAPTDTATRSHGQLRLAVVRPDLLDDWIPELNDVDAQTISCSDNEEAVWWRCPRCGARYQSTVRSRVARGRAACPHCSGTCPHASSAGSAPLSATHPTLAARWDTERNGGLTPSQVTASSSRRVWWRPAASGSAQPSFRRSVFAFVQDASSPWEQAGATALMEWSLLRAIRSAAHIAEAEQLGSLPVRLDVERIASQSPPAWQDAAELVRAETDAQVGESPSAAPPLVTPEDAATVSLLWKTQVKAQLARSQSAGNLCAEVPAMTAAAAIAAPATTTTTPPLSPSAHQDFFGLSSTTARHGSVVEMAATTQPHAYMATASLVREALLNQYVDFVQQKKPQQQARVRHPLPPPVVRLDDAASAASTGKSSWLDFFRLSREDVRPHGYVDPNAALFFSEGPTTTEAVTTRLARGATLKRVSAAAPPVPTPSTAGEAELVFSYYPRRPSNPPSWEDDIAESLPAAVYDTADTKTRLRQQYQQQQQHGKGRRHGGAYALYNPVFRIEAPFGRSENEDTISSPNASLVREYEDDDSSDAVADHASVVRDAGAALAAELRVTPSGGAGSLVDSAIAALGSAFNKNVNPASVDVGDTSSNDRHYRRGAQAPVSALSDRSSRDAVRAASTKPFHLTMPREGLGGSYSWRRTFRSLGDQQPATTTTAATSATAGEAAAPPSTLQFNAPRTPRKVARPRRVRQAAEDAASLAAGEGTD